MPYLYSQAVLDKFDDILRVLSIFDYDAPQQVRCSDVPGLLKMADTYQCRAEFAEYMLQHKLGFSLEGSIK